MDGPTFLLLYIPALVGSVALGAWATRMGEPTTPPRMNWADPYQVASLRDGAAEVIRVAIASLIGRSLLEQHGGSSVRCAPRSGSSASRPLDRALLRLCQEPRSTSSLVGDADLQRQASHYASGLAALGLVAGPELWRNRWMRRYAPVVAVGLIGVVRLVEALAAGHQNVLILIAVTALALVAPVVLPRPPRTPAGDQLLTDLKELFHSLQARPDADRISGAEGELLDAVFGLGRHRRAAAKTSTVGGTLAGVETSFWDSLVPTPPDSEDRHKGGSASSCASSGCGSSDGGSSASSCGSSGGSSCGGGGSGCGGCGGD